MGKDGHKNSKVTEKGDDGSHHAHFGAFTDPHPIENTEQNEGDDGKPQGNAQPEKRRLGTDRGKHHTEVE